MSLPIIMCSIVGGQARSKQCLIGPAITKLSAGDLGGGTSGVSALAQPIIKTHGQVFLRGSHPRR